MATLILVEDHALVTEGIKAMLDKEKDLDCIACCATAEMLWYALQRRQPDIILLDINLPDANGIEVCKELRYKYPVIKIIALSINNQPGIIRQMTENGADGYLLKDADKHEILLGIKTVMQGQNFFSHSAATALRKPEANKLPPLTRREREVLELIADGFTNKEIASKLFVDVTTVDSHRKNMLSKYDVKNTSALIKLAIVHKLL